MNKKVLLPLLCCFSLAGCAGIKNSVPNDLYNSTVWDKNYYSVYDDSLLGASKRNTISLNDTNKIFKSFNDTTFKTLDPIGSELELMAESGESSYSDTYKLANVDDSFKHGYTSKLFDGKMFCFGRYEKVRMQINETGFGMRFAKKLQKSDYFAMNFKAASDFKSGENPLSHAVEFDLNISFYFEEDGAVVYDTFTYHYDTMKANNGERYDFFGFSFENLNIENAIGMAISYSSFVDTVYPDLADSLLIYEVILANSSWN